MTFASQVTYPAGSLSLALGDLNGDGRPDLVTRVGAASAGVVLNLCR